MNLADTRARNGLWLFLVLCAITAVILIMSFSAPDPDEPAPVKPPAENRWK